MKPNYNTQVNERQVTLDTETGIVRGVHCTKTTHPPDCSVPCSVHRCACCPRRQPGQKAERTEAARRRTETGQRRPHGGQRRDRRPQKPTAHLGTAVPPRRHRGRPSVAQAGQGPVPTGPHTAVERDVEMGMEAGAEMEDGDGGGDGDGDGVW